MLASCCIWHTLSNKKAMQVRTNPRDKVFHIGLLRLANVSNTIGEECVGILTCFSSSITGSPIQNVSSTFIDGRGSSWDADAVLLLSFSPLLYLCAFFFFGVVTST